MRSLRSASRQLYDLTSHCAMQAAPDPSAAARLAASCLLNPSITLVVASCFRPVLLQLVRHVVELQQNPPGPITAEYYIALVHLLEVAPHFERCVCNAFAEYALETEAAVIMPEGIDFALFAGCLAHSTSIDTVVTAADCLWHTLRHQSKCCSSFQQQRSQNKALHSQGLYGDHRKCFQTCSQAVMQQRYILLCCTRGAMLEMPSHVDSS